ncbi:MAG: bifunctional metallophosphatase/5'-nucleotidase [Bacteroidales bacterium]
MTLLRTIYTLIILSLSVTLHAQKETTIRIIQTSDVHGSIFPFDYINNEAVDYGLAHVLTYVNNLRENENQEVILLDNGDILQGQPTVYYANYIDTVNKHIVPEVMNYMGYEASTVGNHDIEAGPENYNQIEKEFEFPWLSANIIDKRTGLTYFKPYTIIERNGVKIAVMGLTTPSVPNWLSPKLWEHMQFNDMIESASQWMDSIRINEKPHIIIGLFHAGHDASYEGSDPDEPFNENASALVAQQVPGFDAVLIGHDHSRVLKKIVNNKGDSVLLADPGAKAQFVSDITIRITLDANNNVVNKDIDGSLASMQGLMPSPQLVGKFSKFTQEVENYVDRKIGEITETICTRDAYFGPSTFVNLIHDVQLGVSNVNISFAAPLSFDAVIEKGEIYIRDMFNLYSYENLLYIMKLTGKEVRDYLEYSYGLWLNTMQTKNDNLLLFRENESGNTLINDNGRALLQSSYYNFDSASGILYTVDVSKPKGERITIISMEDGSDFSLDAEYNVAINSYRGTGGGGHLTEGAGISKDELQDRIINVSSQGMRHFLIRWIERTGRISPKKKNNWEIIPKKWAEKAAERDRKLLFGE